VVSHTHIPHGKACHPICIGGRPDLAILLVAYCLPSHHHYIIFTFTSCLPAPFLLSLHIPLSPSTHTDKTFVNDITDSRPLRLSLNREHPAETVYVTGTFDNWSGNTHKLDKEGSVHSKTVELEPTTEKILYKVRRFAILDCWHCPTIPLPLGV
jgi:hypothetical protein